VNSRLRELEGRIQSRDAEIVVIGLGYVGLPLALAFARAGFRVSGIDRDDDRVAQLNAGCSYVEDVAADELCAELEAGRFTATSGFEDASRGDCINICVPTPLRKTKDPDVAHIVAAVEEVRKRLRAGHLIVLGSTTYPGTTHELYRPMLESSGLRVGEDFCLAFAPERIDPGNKAFPLKSVPKLVGGETELCTRLATRMFEPLFDEIVPVSSSRAAEMVKLLENTFRMINIGLANEIAMICNRLGLDVWEVIDAAATKPYGFMKFLPGPGLGGHCIPVDPNYLAWKLRSLKFNARFIELASDINSAMPGWVVQRALRILNRDRLAVNGSRILLLGVAYKAGVSDARESPAVDILTGLEALGARVEYHDAHVPELAIEGRGHKSVELTDKALGTADLVIITTDHAEVDYARVAALAPRVLDTRNATARVTSGSGSNVEKL
jgi:UDP-N-acetyl-D-glucosamine dehydrogenase